MMKFSFMLCLLLALVASAQTTGAVAAVPVDVLGEAVCANDSSSQSEKMFIWPEGQIPDLQTNMYYKPFIVWHKPRRRRTDAVAIVCSGGGYNGSLLDGFELPPLRDYLLDKGMTVVALRYRGPRPAGLPRHALAWQDAQRAIRMVRTAAPSMGLNSEKIGFVGFSAGGHLAVLSATSSQTAAYDAVDELDCVPCHVNWAVAVYPAYGFASESERLELESANDLSAPLAKEFAFDKKTAPVCLIHGDRDVHSPMASVRIYHKLRTMGIPSELHVLAYEDHCFMKAAYAGTVAAEWKELVGGWLAVMGLSSIHPNTRAPGWKCHFTSHWRGMVESVADCEKDTWKASDNNGFSTAVDRPLLLRGKFGVCMLDFEYRASPDRGVDVLVRNTRIPLPRGKCENIWRRATVWFSRCSWTLAVDGEIVSREMAFRNDVPAEGRLGFCGHGGIGVLAVRNVCTRLGR